MRVQRHKANRKTLDFYRLLFAIRPPYRVLLDGNFIATAGGLKMEWRRLLPKLLGVLPHLVHLHVTQCAIAELEALGERAAGALAEARALPLLTCRVKHGHGVGCEPAECATRLVGSDNAGKWLVASQDAGLRSALRSRVPGVPIILISSNVLILEPPAAASRAASAAAEVSKTTLTPEEAAAVRAAVRRERAGGGAGEAVATAGGVATAPSRATGGGGGIKRKRRGASEPNPLSNRAKKPRPPVLASSGGGGGGGEGGGAAGVKSSRRKRVKRSDGGSGAAGEGGGGDDGK